MATDEDAVFLLPESDKESFEEDHVPAQRAKKFPLYWRISCLLLLSVVMNVLLATIVVIGTSTNILASQCSTRSINHHSGLNGLFHNVQQPLYPKDVYEWTVDSNATDKRFKSFNPDHGLVALPKNQPNVLPSEQFPWDASKEVYVLAGYHSLHSLQVIWHELHKLSGEVPLTSHVLHSLNVLWGDILCAASTTPLSISRKYVTNRTAIDEAAQTRQCRDWNEVERFRLENTACFKDLGAARKKKPMIEEWQFCPDSSPYKKIVDEYLAESGKQDG